LNFASKLVLVVKRLRTQPCGFQFIGVLRFIVQCTRECLTLHHGGDSLA